MTTAVHCLECGFTTDFEETADPATLPRKCDLCGQPLYLDETENQWIHPLDTDEQRECRMMDFIESAVENGIEIQCTSIDVKEAGLWLKDKETGKIKDIPCDVVGRCELGNWVALTREGNTINVPDSEVW